MLVEKADDDDSLGIDPEEQRVGKLRKPDPAIGFGDHVECLRKRSELFDSTLELCENSSGEFRTLAGIPSDGFFDLRQTRVDESRVHFANLARRDSMASRASTELISPFL